MALNSGRVLLVILGIAFVDQNILCPCSVVVSYVLDYLLCEQSA